MKILSEMYLWTGKSWLNFGSHPYLDLDLGIFKGFAAIPRYSMVYISGNAD